MQDSTAHLAEVLPTSQVAATSSGIAPDIGTDTSSGAEHPSPEQNGQHNGQSSGNPAWGGNGHAPRSGDGSCVSRARGLGECRTADDPSTRGQTQNSKGGRKKTRARLIAAGVQLVPGQPVRCALDSAEVVRADPGQSMEDRLRRDVLERNKDGRPTQKACCAALRLACGSIEQAATILDMDYMDLAGMVKSDNMLVAARRDGAREGKRIFESSLYAALRAGDTGALALWAKYYGWRSGVIGESSTVGAAVRMGWEGGNGGAGGELIDLGREVRGLLDVTDRELVEALRVSCGGGGACPGSPASGPGRSVGSGTGSGVALGDLVGGLSKAAQEVLEVAAGDQQAGDAAAVPAVPVVAPEHVGGGSAVPGPAAAGGGAGDLWGRLLRSGGRRGQGGG